MNQPRRTFLTRLLAGAAALLVPWKAKASANRTLYYSEKLFTAPVAGGAVSTAWTHTATKDTVRISGDPVFCERIRNSLISDGWRIDSQEWTRDFGSVSAVKESPA